MQTAKELNLNWVDVCALHDLPENMGAAALVGDIQIALFYIKKLDQVFALNNFDPFSEASVLSRGIVGSIGEELVIASPIYKEHFNLQTGQCVEDESVSIDTYPVKITDGRVMLGLSS